MKYGDFEYVMSQARMSRYLNACGGNTRKSMTLYRINLKLSQELFTIVSCYEVALRNAINEHYTVIYGTDWLRDSVQPGGFFDNSMCRKTVTLVTTGFRKINPYTPSKLIAEMDFGFWRYLFANHQFRYAGQSLLAIFPLKPTSTIANQYNSNFIFSELEKINYLRNRLAHHETVCFRVGTNIIDTTYARHNYELILQLFQWMRIDHNSLLYGLDHVVDICNRLENF
jgi:hypothetical protein